MNFRLEKQAAGAAVTRFHVLNARNDICGIVSVLNSEADDLQRHWRGTSPAAPNPGAMARVLLRAAKCGG